MDQVIMEKKDLSKEILSAVSGINKKRGNENTDDPIIFVPSLRPELVELKYVQSNVPQLNHALNGGFARKTIHLLAGDPGTGKTSIALSCLAQCQREGGWGLYICTEPPFPIQQAETLGVDMSKVIVLNPLDSADEMLDLVTKLLYDEDKRIPRGWIDCIVYDSLTNTVPQSTVKRIEKKGEASVGMTERARLLTSVIERIQGRGLLRKETIMFLIAQLRSNLDPYGEKLLISAPNIAFFNAKTIIMMKKKQLTTLHKDLKVNVPWGHQVTCFIRKNNVSGTPTAISYVWDYTNGLDDSKSLVAIGIENKLIIKSGKMYTVTLEGTEHDLGSKKDEIPDNCNKLNITDSLRKAVYESMIKSSKENTLKEEKEDSEENSDE